jgi:hypothetical protein
MAFGGSGSPRCAGTERAFMAEVVHLIVEQESGAINHHA